MTNCRCQGIACETEDREHVEARDRLLGHDLVDVVTRREGTRTRRLPSERRGHKLCEIADDRPGFRLFALWGVGVVFEASRGSWAVSWDDDRTQEFALGASSTKSRT